MCVSPVPAPAHPSTHPMVWFPQIPKPRACMLFAELFVAVRIFQISLAHTTYKLFGYAPYTWLATHCISCETYLLPILYMSHSLPVRAPREYIDHIPRCSKHFQTTIRTGYSAKTLRLYNYKTTSSMNLYVKIKIIDVASSLPTYSPRFKTNMQD